MTLRVISQYFKCRTCGIIIFIQFFTIGHLRDTGHKDYYYIEECSFQ